MSLIPNAIEVHDQTRSGFASPTLIELDTRTIRAEWALRAYPSRTDRAGAVRRVVGKARGGGMLKHVDDEQRGPPRCVADAGDVESCWDRL
jgi:hypothetical protein